MSFAAVDGEVCSTSAVGLNAAHGTSRRDVADALRGDSPRVFFHPSLRHHCARSMSPLGFESFG
jgi:hypothetical protein